VSVQILRYRVVLTESDEGFSVSCPSLPGCWSQGATRQEALENVADAIRVYLAAMADLRPEGQVAEVEVAV
jgi:predicted RNase H-like HicB family nuclease